MSRSISPDSPNKNVIGVQYQKDPIGQKNINLAHKELLSFGIGIPSEASKFRHLCYKALDKHLSAFVLSNYKQANADIKRVDQAFLNDFDYCLWSDKNCENNYAVKNVKNLGKILRIGLENGWVEKDHFLGYKDKTKNVDRYYLNQ